VDISHFPSCTLDDPIALSSSVAEADWEAGPFNIYLLCVEREVRADGENIRETLSKCHGELSQHHSKWDP
jgi:hypothetical protein